MRIREIVLVAPLALGLGCQHAGATASRDQGTGSAAAEAAMPENAGEPGRIGEQQGTTRPGLTTGAPSSGQASDDPWALGTSSARERAARAESPTGTGAGPNGSTASSGTAQ
jgi:hypothetical protein